MDPTKHIKAAFGDLLMQITVLQAELEYYRRQLADLEDSVKDDKNT
jgi:cell division protein FtsB